MKLVEHTGLKRFELALNVDGLPLFKSSSNGALWPLLCQVVNLDKARIFPVTLTLGGNKPHNLDFLNEEISELKSLMAG